MWCPQCEAVVDAPAEWVHRCCAALRLRHHGVWQVIPWCSWSQVLSEMLQPLSATVALLAAFGSFEADSGSG